MPLNIKTELGNIKIQVKQNPSDKSMFDLNLGDIDNTQMEYPLDILDNYFEPIENYEIYLFKNRLGISERDIFQISTKKGTIAWMLPLSIYHNEFDFSSEISQSHLMRDTKFEKSHNLFLKKVAYPVFYKLLLAEKTPSKISEQNENYTLFDFYDYDMNVLIVSKERLENLDATFNLDFYLPSLYKYGYVLLDSKESFEDIYSKKLIRNPYSKDLKTFDAITIHPLADDLLNEKYAIELFNNVLKRKLHPLVRFHFLYQVIELLINKIGVEHHKKTIKNNKNIDADFIISYLHNFNHLISESFQSAHEIKQSISTLATIHQKLDVVPNEEDRIGMLFNHSKIKDDNYKELLVYSKKITNMNEKDLHKNIYKLRNALVHSYHDLYKKDNTIDNKIEDANMEFENLIVDVLIQYAYK